MEIPLLILIAGIVAMDTTSGPQLMISEPLISCFLAGLVIGNPATGLALGLFFQLLWLDYKPLGTGRFTDSKMGSFIAAASYLATFRMLDMETHMSQALMYPALIVALMAGFAGSVLRDWVRETNGRQTEKMLGLLQAGVLPNIAQWHFRGVGRSFLRGVIMAVVLIPVGLLICSMMKLLPTPLARLLASTMPLLWAAVLASAFVTFWVKGFRRYLLAGILGGGAWILVNLIRFV